MFGLILDTREMSGGGGVYSPAVSIGTYSTALAPSYDSGSGYVAPSYTAPSYTAPSLSVNAPTYSVAAGTMQEKPFNDPRLQSEIVYLGDTPVESLSSPQMADEGLGLGKLLLIGLGLMVLSKL